MVQLTTARGSSHANRIRLAGSPSTLRACGPPGRYAIDAIDINRPCAHSGCPVVAEPGRPTLDESGRTMLRKKYAKALVAGALMGATVLTTVAVNASPVSAKQEVERPFKAEGAGTNVLDCDLTGFPIVVCSQTITQTFTGTHIGLSTRLGVGELEINFFDRCGPDDKVPTLCQTLRTRSLPPTATSCMGPAWLLVASSRARQVRWPELGKLRGHWTVCECDRRRSDIGSRSWRGSVHQFDGNTHLLTSDAQRPRTKGEPVQDRAC